MSDRSRARFLSRVACATATAGVLSTSGARAQTSGTPLTVLRVGCIPSDGVTSVIYAKKAGLFRDAGLDVQIETVNSGAAAAAAVVSGVYDIGQSSITTVLLAHEKGIPFTFVAPSGVYDSKFPYAGAIALKDAPIRSGKDLENAVLSVSALNDIGHDAFCAWVDQRGGDARTMRFVEVPFSTAGAAVEQHRVVAAEIATPTMTAALDTGNFRFIPTYSAIAPAFLVSAWFATKEVSTKHADALRKFARVVATAGAYANSHRAETAPIMSEFTKIPVEVYLRMPRALQGGTLSAGLIQPAITVAAKYGSLKQTFRAEELLDASLLP